MSSIWPHLDRMVLEWFYGVKPISISSFDQLRTNFVSRFIGLRTRKNDKTYWCSLKQWKNESLKNYVWRFTKEINIIEGLTDRDIIAALREGLEEAKLLRSYSWTFIALWMHRQRTLDNSCPPGVPVRYSMNVHSRSSRKSIAIVDKGLVYVGELGNMGRTSFRIKPL